MAFKYRKEIDCLGMSSMSATQIKQIIRLKKQ